MALVAGLYAVVLFPVLNVITRFAIVGPVAVGVDVPLLLNFKLVWAEERPDANKEEANRMCLINEILLMVV